MLGTSRQAIRRVLMFIGPFPQIPGKVVHKIPVLLILLKVLIKIEMVLNECRLRYDAGVLVGRVLDYPDPAIGEAFVNLCPEFLAK